MKSATQKILMPGLQARGLVILVALLGLGFLGGVLIPGLRLAGDLVESSASLKMIGEQQRYPALIRASLDAVRDRLNNRSYLQESIDELRNAAARLDAVLGTPDAAAVGRAAAGGPAGPAAGFMSGRHGAALRDLWAQERAVLDAVVGFKGVPYRDSESTGTALNDSGRELDRNIMAAIRTSRHVLPLIDKHLAAVSDELQSNNAQSAQEVRLVMVAGLVIAVMLVVLVTVLLGARKRQDASLREARQQTADILRTVKDGLFLVDADLVIGAAYSHALESMFHRTDIAGLPFESLLKDLVSEKTLATAAKFIKILWTERTKENLVKSINPLGEVEVHLETGGGRFETRYLQFDFHRVRVDGKITHVLVAVSDVSARVDLARDLKAAQGQAQAQVDTLLGILHIDPNQLASFLSDSNASMAMINAILREPAREESAFRKKLDTLFRQAHAVKGEAAALGLSSIESRAHSFEEDLKALRERPELSGNDFLPLVIKLDDLLTHLQSIGELVSRLSHLQPAQAPAGEPEGHAATDVISVAQAPMASDAGLAVLLEDLASRLARTHHKEVALQCGGLQAIPAEYRRTVKDIAIQSVRNAIVHGIEPAAAREAAGKPRQGTVRLAFQPAEDDGYKLNIEDDGQGLSAIRIVDVALQKGLISPGQAAGMNSKQIYALIFKPGFSTAEEPTADAGRGVGMNVIAELVQEAGGRVSLATVEGKFTRFTLTLPDAPTAASDTAAA